jgi:hypothetical protein
MACLQVLKKYSDFLLSLAGSGSIQQVPVPDRRTLSISIVYIPPRLIHVKVRTNSDETERPAEREREREREREHGRYFRSMATNQSVGSAMDGETRSVSTW